MWASVSSALRVSETLTTLFLLASLHYFLHETFLLSSERITSRVYCLSQRQLRLILERINLLDCTEGRPTINKMDSMAVSPRRTIGLILLTRSPNRLITVYSFRDHAAKECAHELDLVDSGQN